MKLSDTFIADIKIILATARQQAYSAINASMVKAYRYLGKKPGRTIGHLIVENIKRKITITFKN